MDLYLHVQRKNRRVFMMAAPTLQTQDYDDTGAALNALAAEPAFLHYRVHHEFNRPAECTIILNADTTTVRKYDVDAAGDSVWIGPGGAKVTGEDAAQIFYGRILKSKYNPENHTVTLTCRDWMDQLSEKHITYDMREKLSGNIRQSVVYPDYDDTDGNGINPAFDAGGGTYYVYDSQIGLTADAHNGKYMILTADMAGDITVTTSPYTYATTAANDVFSGAGDIGHLWTVDTDNHNTNGAAAFNTIYDFKVWVPDSDFHSATKLTGAKIILYYIGSTSSSTIQINSGGYKVLASADTVGAGAVWQTVSIPENLVAGSLDASGIVQVKLDEAAAGGGGFIVYYIAVEYQFETIGYSSAIAISDGETYRLTVGTNLATDATRVWHGLPYCVCDLIMNNIDDIVTGGDAAVTAEIDPLVALSTSVGTTTGISSKHWEQTTRLQVLKDLAAADKAVFYVALNDATPTVIWKKTWATADPTDLKDADVLSWSGEWSYPEVFNQANVYGVRIGDNQIYEESSSATSKTTYGVTRTKVVRSSYVSEYDCAAAGAAMVDANDDALLFLQCRIHGLYAGRVGDERDVTCAKYNLTDAKYVITHFDYDSQSGVTALRLHPRADLSTHGYTDHHLIGENFRSTTERVHDYGQSQYVPEPFTNEIA